MRLSYSAHGDLNSWIFFSFFISKQFDDSHICSQGVPMETQRTLCLHRDPLPEALPVFIVLNYYFRKAINKINEIKINEFKAS